MASITANLPLSGYGKLPIARDFLRLRVNGPGGQAIVSVLEGAVESFASMSPTAGSTILYLPLTDGSVALATIRPSADEGELRSWPFAFYTEIPAGLASALVSGPWVGCIQLVAAMDHAHSQTAELTDALDFDRKFSEVHLPTVGPGDRESTASSIPLASWAKSLFGDDEDFALACWRLRLARRAVATGKPVVGLRMPLAQGFDWAAQADAWLTAIGISPAAMLIAPGPSDGRTLTVFLRPIKNTDLSLIADHRVEGLVDLTVPQAASTLDGFGAFADGVAERSREATLSRLNWVIET